MATLTIKQVEDAIKTQKAEREKALAQANFHAGCLAAWEDLKTFMESPEAPEEPTADGEPTPPPPDGLSNLLKLMPNLPPGLTPSDIEQLAGEPEDAAIDQPVPVSMPVQRIHLQPRKFGKSKHRRR